MPSLVLIMLAIPLEFTAAFYAMIMTFVSAGLNYDDAPPDLVAPCPVAEEYDFAYLSRNIPTRQNNPLNIVRTRHYYSGELPSSIRFERFRTPEAGFAAAFKVFERVHEGKGRTVAQVLNIWAPPYENDTNAYTRYVIRNSSLDGSEVLSLSDPETLIELFAVMSGYEGFRVPDPSWRIDLARKGHELYLCAKESAP